MAAPDYLPAPSLGGAGDPGTQPGTGLPAPTLNVNSGGAALPAPSLGIRGPDQPAAVDGGDREPETALGKVVDLFLRGQYASAAFLDEILTSGGGLALGKAFAAAADEIYEPEQRLSYHDILKTHAPVWSAAHPGTARVLGLVGDIALDPTTWLTAGVGGATKFVTVGGKVVLREGAEAAAKKGATTLGRTVSIGQKTVPLSKEGDKLFKQVLKRQQAKGLTGEAARESADKVFSRIVTNENWSDVLTASGGIKFAGKTIGGKYQGKLYDFVSTQLGLKGLKSALADIPAATALRKTFLRNADLPEEYVQVRKHLEAELHFVDEAVAQETVSLFRGLGKESFERLGRAASEIDEATKTASKAKGTPLTVEEARRIADEYLLTAGIEGKEFTAFSQMRRRYQEIGDIEQHAGLLSRMLLNYSPKAYDVIHDAKGFTGLRRKLRNKASTKFGPAEHRTVKNMAEAPGDLIQDAAVLYASRVMEHRRALARKNFDDAVGKIFPDGKIPRTVREDITYVGEGLYSKGVSETANGYLRLYDGMMSIFRKAATVLRPSFGARQLVGNSMQTFLEMGAKAYGAFDPRTIQDAMLILNGKSGSFGIKSNLGHYYSGNDVKKLAQEFGIIRGTSIDGVTTGPTGLRMARGLSRQINQANKLKKIAGSQKGAEGLQKFMHGVTKYTSWPAKIEDMARVSTFMNGLRLGHSPTAAARITDNALFDYLNGLSAIEQRVIRRLVPFYSYQRFAVPLITRAAVNAPGRIINPLKAADTLFSAWSSIASGDQLNESERAAIPGWLLEQPAAFERLDEKQRAVFRTFNNFTPLDTFGFVSTNETGDDMDIQQTILQGGLAQLTPFIKVPLEFAVRKDFFTGRALPENMRGARRKLGPVNPDIVLRHLASIAGSQMVGNPAAGAAGGAAVAELVNSLPGNPSEAVLKTALGWEEGVDPKTGERAVWVNPFLMQTLVSSNPALLDAFKLGRTDRSPLERTMQFLFGVGTAEVDLKQQKQFKLKSLQSKQKDLVYEIRKAEREQRPNDLDRAIEDLKEFQIMLKEEALTLNAQPIRGGE